MYIRQKVYKFKFSKLVYAILLSESLLGNFNPFCYTIKCWVDVMICKTIIYWNFSNIIVDCLNAGLILHDSTSIRKSIPMNIISILQAWDLSFLRHVNCCTFSFKSLQISVNLLLFIRVLRLLTCCGLVFLRPALFLSIWFIVSLKSPLILVSQSRILSKLSLPFWKMHFLQFYN